MYSVLRCDQADMLPTGECLSPYWVEEVGMLPAMSVPEAYEIAVAIGALWAVAWVIRLLRRSLEVRIGI